METKEELIHKIKHLLELDGKIIHLKKQKDILEKERKILSTELIEVMKKHELNKIDTNSGSIRHNVVKSKPLGKRNLVKLLEEFYKDDEKAGEVSQYIFDNLKERITEKIVVKYDKVAPNETTGLI